MSAKFEAPYLLCFKHVRLQCFKHIICYVFTTTHICCVWIHSLAVFETYCLVWSKHILCYVLNTLFARGRTNVYAMFLTLFVIVRTHSCIRRLYSFNMWFVTAWTHTSSSVMMRAHCFVCLLHLILLCFA